MEGEKGELKDKIKDITKQTLFKEINKKIGGGVGAVSPSAGGAAVSAVGGAGPMSIGPSLPMPVKVCF